MKSKFLLQEKSNIYSLLLMDSILKTKKRGC